MVVRAAFLLSGFILSSMTLAYLERIQVVQRISYAYERENYVVKRVSGVEGLYHGVYVCSQGPTNLVLQVGPLNNYNEGVAVFTFFPTDSHPEAAQGSFEMRYNRDPATGGYDFYPYRWMIRPRDYAMVGMSVDEMTVNRRSQIIKMQGSVNAPGCLRFDLHRLD